MNAKGESRRTGTVPVIRAVRIPFGESPIPRDWWGGNAFESLRANAVNLLFPAGERFFVRSVRHYADGLRDPELKARVRAFVGQESAHAREHETFFDIMRQQGYRIDGFLRGFQRIAFDTIEPRVPAALKLSTTAAAEHFTAMIGEVILTEKMHEASHPAMRALFYWHSVEELEHKAVAYDVLGAVNPSYALRIVGLCAATGLVGISWAIAAAMLAVQDGPTGLRRMLAEVRAAPPRSVTQEIFLAGMRDYLRRDFHPDDRDHTALIQTTLQALAMAPADTKNAA